MANYVQLPTMHLSMRVPWHDNGWNGAVCHNPLANTSCLVLDRIAQSRDDDFEVKHAGQHWTDVDQQDIEIGCRVERGAFMSDKAYDRWMSHAYAKQYGGSNLHSNFKPTRLRFEPHSAIATPFRWMNKSMIKMMKNERDNDKSNFDPVQWYGIPFNRDLEPSDEELGFKSRWVQHPDNQLLLLNTFGSAIEPEKSLVFFYAKDVPLTENPGRVIVGVGLVSYVSDVKSYETSDNGELWRGYLWERNVGHTIRKIEDNNFEGGFLLPYQEIMDAAKMDSAINPERYVAFAPEEAWDNFSYATAHVPHDEAISALLECRGALERMKADHLPIAGRRGGYINWIDEQLNRLWKMRGPYPGMGSALSAFGVENGTLVAYEINKSQVEFKAEYREDPWEQFELVLKNPDLVPNTKRFLKGIDKLWNVAKPEDHNLLKLLSRFNINQEQAKKYYKRELAEELMANPYSLYEKDRYERDGVSLRTIDRGLFPDTIIRDKYPLPEPANMEGESDPRRIRAFAIYYLEGAAREGHSLLPRPMLLERMSETDITKTLTVNDVILDLAEQEAFGDFIEKAELSEAQSAYQLSDIAACVRQIKSIDRKLTKGKPHDGDYNWQNILNERFGPPVGYADEQELENLARQEKAIALEKLYRSRFSVLIGGAGTGKTTLLSVLCNSSEIGQSVLLLAPTGKARVRMESGIEAQTANAQTIAQFLYRYGLYDGERNRYALADRSQRFDGLPDNVIIDECSMLTEPQLASLLSVVRSAKRIIMVGDPQQLPPIGTGRPFIDIKEHIEANHSDSFAELSISRRQQGEGRDDLTLANWFSGRPIPAGEDDIWERIANGEANNIQAIRWDEPHELQEILFNAIREYLNDRKFDAKVPPGDEFDRFAYSFGGSKYSEQVKYPFFNRNYVGELVESWQILSPVRGDMFGVRALNRAIQHHFQHRVRTKVNTPKAPAYRKFPSPIGNEEILYGDKVINVINHARNNDYHTPGGSYAVFPNEGALEYIANGEIGVVVGHRRTNKRDWVPENLEVEFASQNGFAYTYQPWEFGENSNAPLELAYALTIHKAQGSEFGAVFLIIPNPIHMLSRELLYTALTRQKDKVILLHQGDFTDLRKYTDPIHSDIARRITNLFREPNPQPVKLGDEERPLYMEQNLIHRTPAGVRVRSKSELAIARELEHRGLIWDYEKPFAGKLPDFAIEDDLGRIVYWEHLGMLHVPQYARKWQQKRQWYLEQGILPYEEDDGDSDILVTTRDDENGGLDLQNIDKILDDLFG